MTPHIEWEHNAMTGSFTVTFPILATVEKVRDGYEVWYGPHGNRMRMGRFRELTEVKAFVEDLASGISRLRQHVQD